MLDKMNGSFFEKSHEDAFFFHTNTLYLLLTVDRKIEAELQAAAAEQQTEHALAYAYQTNLTDLISVYTTQIMDALNSQEGRLETNVNAETRRMGVGLSVELASRIRSLAPDAAEIARRQQVTADLTQLKSDLDRIKARMGITNLPATRP